MTYSLRFCLIGCRGGYVNSRKWQALIEPSEWRREYRTEHCNLLWSSLSRKVLSFNLGGGGRKEFYLKSEKPQEVTLKCCHCIPADQRFPSLHTCIAGPVETSCNGYSFVHAWPRLVGNLRCIYANTEGVQFWIMRRSYWKHAYFKHWLNCMLVHNNRYPENLFVHPHLGTVEVRKQTAN